MLRHIFFKIFSHAVHTLVVTIYPYVVNVINDLSYVATVDTVYTDRILRFPRCHWGQILS